ncbi:serine/threonine-protein phosphatase 2A activator 2 [Delitschia confertaspora ATCC 74209]|uniref:Serine/threonine-protein phosphatase 2A activator n=1 Tax=Delitschia confertaspora ATCC 74209 TaxID=1513339 RepID=A0A9P4JLM0_9PLEO|nr:serine/threonine-protein phosphatase 2A activator 2 [Delitschia confertaspora ATCC 74209]
MTVPSVPSASDTAVPGHAAENTSSPPDLSAKLPRLIPRRRNGPTSQHSESAPPPPTPPLSAPPSLDNWTYVHPSRRILSPADLELFLKSETYTLVTSFIFTLSDSIHDRAISSVKESEITPVVRTILSILSSAEDILHKCPPKDTGSRFGNPVFRDFVDEISAALPEWHKRLGLDNGAQVEEVSTYLLHSFGNKTRIDYGSGHELNFFLWLLCLNRLSLLPPDTFPQLVLVILPAYLKLIRSVQMAYYLEPAGSHGVWGLDDYQFLPFLFGASQLLHHPYITPKAIHNTLTLEEFGHDFLYLNQVAFVNSVKNVDGLRWHSPMLDDISSAKSWSKIEAGMRKMFIKEILNKLPVMQHFLFGSLIPAVEGMSREEDYGLNSEEEEAEGGEVKVWTDDDGKRHVHASTGWGDCCGIRVPSTVGANEEMRKKMGLGGLRRVPFD